MADYPPPLHDHREKMELERDDAQLPVLRNLMVLTTITIFLGWYKLSLTPSDHSLLLVTVTASLLLSAAYWLMSRSTAASAAFLLSSYIAVALLWAVIQGSSQIWYFFTLPIVSSCFLFGPWASLLCSVGTIALFLLTVPHSSVWHGQPLLMLATGITSWAAYRPIYTALVWSWRRSFETTALAEQLQDQRGKLNRTVKDLDASYKLLQQTNRELALARKEADALRELRSRFATNLSHELRTPLNIVLGFAEFVYLNPNSYGYNNWNENLRRDLGQIQRNASYLLELTDDIVDMARVDALAMPVQKEKVDLRPLIWQAMESVRNMALEKGLPITVSFVPGLREVYVDPLRIQQVMVNLLTNAVRYTDEGSIQVTVEQTEDEVTVRIKDTGQGIPPEEMDSIFDEFYQVGRPRQSGNSGKGLGLAIAKRFIRLHGGRIWVESQVGCGSVFAFSLPLFDRAISIGGGPAKLPIPSSRLKTKIAVVDGDDTAASYLNRRLEEYDFQWVDRIGSVPESETQPAAYILNSAWLGDQEAHIIERMIAQIPETVPVVSCSLPQANALQEDSLFVAFLTKPVSRDGLERVVKETLPKVDSPLVLVADDDRGFVELVRRWLGASEVGRTIAAYDGAQTIERIREMKPDLVLLDLMMPGLSGFEVARLVRRDSRLVNTPLIAVTATTPGEDQREIEGARLLFRRGRSFQPGELPKLLAIALSLGCAGSSGIDQS